MRKNEIDWLDDKSLSSLLTITMSQIYNVISLSLISFSVSSLIISYNKLSLLRWKLKWEVWFVKMRLILKKNIKYHKQRKINYFLLFVRYIWLWWLVDWIDCEMIKRQHLERNIINYLSHNLPSHDHHLFQNLIW